MPSKRHIFSLSGPVHLTAVDWTNPHHRRSILASLVQGVYRQERDRLDNRDLAPPWWESFHFRLYRVLTDVDGSIIGAIYEFPASSAPNLPIYVIAFRGIIKKPSTILRDLKSGFQCILNDLHRSSRFQRAMPAVQEIVASAGAANVLLAGHSMGSAIALLVGKKMVKMGYILETFLFNPPFVGLPIDLIKNEKLKQEIRYATTVFKSGLAAIAVEHSDHEPFAALSCWFPQLFVNKDDPFCAEYIGYFRNREDMKQSGAKKIERVAGNSSITSLISEDVHGQVKGEVNRWESEEEEKGEGVTASALISWRRNWVHFVGDALGISLKLLSPFECTAAHHPLLGLFSRPHCDEFPTPLPFSVFGEHAIDSSFRLPSFS
ncbi:GDSL esterase/lipase At4g10955-like [Corylus avellana]|uniref:GDSL esterase/lipase At4g10955-like n=1 Tax=Corylus avellana TaxID=13451 RepID=UPI00286D1A84|nr:GDSL esterase/lipase At4g10955-like [Corylus avellana]